MTVEGIKPHRCKCGKDHLCAVSEVVTGNGAINLLPEKLRLLGGAKPFILADKNTFAACGEKVTEILKNEEIAYSSYVFPHGDVKPDEKAIGAAIMHFDSSCDIVVGVGSGVINDISKILANVSKSKYIIVATAPSMDGYASATSSVDRDGLKISLQSRCADIIIGDTEILKNAPEKSLVSGLGDIIAKYISIAEW
ncbi:MAG: iron-containing alcohol dehydrogenase, partial [Clostridia bacterium]|nr:iron-containing alcohol dehydrogenase [Clostridia bacterium]